MGWILFLSVATLVAALNGTVVAGRTLPPALLPVIAGVEAAAALAFAARASAVALALLYAAFAAALTVHAMLGQNAWWLYVYFALALGFHLADARHNMGANQA